jgi:hypothetical protein
MKEMLQSRTSGGKPRVVVARTCKHTVQMLSEFDTEKLFADAAPMTDIFDANRYMWPAVSFTSKQAQTSTTGRQGVVYGGIV